LYDPLQEKMDCQLLVEGGVIVNVNMVLFRKDFPNYFDEILKSKLSITEDISHNQYPLEFKSRYLDLYNIKSSLHSPFIVNGELSGIIFCEQKSDSRMWQAEDTIFIRALSNLVSMGLLTQRIKEQNASLFNSNETLEVAVKKRTIELELQNEQLTEYAFINSHLLRAPLARILGIANLFIMESAGKMNDKLLVQGLIESTNELDAIIRKISDVLYNGHDLTREEVKSIIQKNFNR
jgi:signal transduction histidine kinase